MTANKTFTATPWTDPDDAPELSGDWFAGATVHENGMVKRLPGQRGPGRKPAKASVTLRLDADIIAYFREDGRGWQTRMNDALKAIVSGKTKGSK